MLTRCPAWKSIYELEESLTIEEMFLLYRASNHHFHMTVKSQAAAMGADVDWEEDWYDPKPPVDNTLQGSEVKYLPIGLGYESS